MATVSAQRVVRRLSTINLQEDRAEVKPPFGHPCMNNSTCPEGKLEPTYWDRPDQYEYFKDLNILLSSTAPRSTSTPSITNGTASGSSRSSGSVIGGAVGGTLGFLAIVAVVIFLLWRRKTRVRKQTGGDSMSSMEENNPIGELASPVSAGTAPPTYPWDINRSPTSPQVWTHIQAEVAGDDSKDSRRSPFTELHSKSSLACIAELPAGIVANELDAPEIDHKSWQSRFDSDLPKHTGDLDDETHIKPRRSTERR
ncbi:hypothetical protein E8E13_007339 [Curvularia kusanoi]|uniref:Uncharacterized protein n=1 Tax=Curvularia kusanoi TaxID=90978 RepID=A0A9P4TPF2_CURKU|nr:hypothetical protein E8E13_007339 [Curvularia kusanoi]